MLLIGTSGFSYDDWRGAWYPPKLPRCRMFDYYAERMSTVEINSTFYHIFSPRMMDSLVRRAAGRVYFAVKMSALVTHEGLLMREVISSYSRGIEPAAEAKALGAVLLQFPMRFRHTPENRRYLLATLRAFAAFPLVVEIRHQSWRSPEAIRFFSDGRINLCLTDMPRLPGLPSHSLESPGRIGYVRFHGRNAGQWFGGTYPGARYDYDYSRDELSAWTEPIGELTRKSETTLVFFNNHVRAQAPNNAAMLAQLLGEPQPVAPYQDLFTTRRAGCSPAHRGADY